MSFFTHRATASSAAIATTVAPGTPWQLKEIRGHLDAAGAATALTATMDAGAGATYNTLLYTLSMGSVTDFSKSFDPPLPMTASDEVDIAYANGSSAAYGVEVIFMHAD